MVGLFVSDITRLSLSSLKFASAEWNAAPGDIKVGPFVTTKLETSRPAGLASGLWAKQEGWNLNKYILTQI